MVSELLMLMGNLLFPLESSYRISTSSLPPELSHHPEQGQNNHFYHWVGKTEAQRGQRTCLRSHSKSVAEPSLPSNSLTIIGSFLECLLCARHCAPGTVPRFFPAFLHVILTSVLGGKYYHWLHNTDFKKLRSGEVTQFSEY